MPIESISNWIVLHSSNEMWLAFGGFFFTIASLFVTVRWIETNHKVCITFADVTISNCLILLYILYLWLTKVKLA